MDNFVKEAENAVEGNQQQTSGQTEQPAAAPQGGNSFLGGLTQAGEDGALNTGLNSFMTKEGIPAGADGAVDAFVDKEANQFLGGNKNF